MAAGVGAHAQAALRQHLVRDHERAVGERARAQQRQRAPGLLRVLAFALRHLHLHLHVGVGDDLTGVVGDETGDEGRLHPEHDIAELDARAALDRRQAHARAEARVRLRFAAHREPELRSVGSLREHEVEAAVVARLQHRGEHVALGAPQCGMDRRGPRTGRRTGGDGAVQQAAGEQRVRAGERHRDVDHVVRLRRSRQRSAVGGLAIRAEPRGDAHLRADLVERQQHGLRTDRLVGALRQDAARQLQPGAGGEQRRHGTGDAENGRRQHRRAAVVDDVHAQAAEGRQHELHDVVGGGPAGELDRRRTGHERKRAEAFVGLCLALAHELEVLDDRAARAAGVAAPDRARLVGAGLLHDRERHGGGGAFVGALRRERDLLVGHQRERERADARRHHAERELAAAARRDEPRRVGDRQLRDAVGAGERAHADRLGPLGARQRADLVAEPLLRVRFGDEQDLRIGDRDRRLAAHDLHARRAALLGQHLGARAVVGRQQLARGVGLAGDGAFGRVAGGARDGLGRRRCGRGRRRRGGGRWRHVGAVREPRDAARAGHQARNEQHETGAHGRVFYALPRHGAKWPVVPSR